MANRNKNYIADNKRAGNNSNTFSNDPDKGINEAQGDADYAMTVMKDGEVVVKDGALIAGAVATGGAGAAAAPAAGAGGAAGGAAAAGGSAAAAGSGAAGAGTAAAAEGAAGTAVGAAGESAATSAASDAAISATNTPGADALSVDPTDAAKSADTTKLAGDAENGISDVSDAAKEASGEGDSLLQEESKSPEDKEDKLKKNIEDSIKKGQDAKGTLGKEKDFYKSKNFMDAKKRSERKRLAQQKIDDKGKDDRGVMERTKDAQVAKTGFDKLDASGDAIDTVGRAAGSAVDAGTGGKTNARESLGGVGSELTGAAGRLGNATERRLTKFSKYALKVPLVGAAAAMLVPIMILISFASFGVTVAATSSVAYGGDACRVENQTDLGNDHVIDEGESGGSFAWEKLSDTQKSNATQVIKAAADRDIPAQAAVIALATAMQESGLIVVDHGDKAGPDSRGMFQQRDSWGTVADRMNPYKSANLFYDRLVNVPNWDKMPVTQAAQAVQISAFPDAYAKHEESARNVLANAITNANPYASELSGLSEWVGAAGGDINDEEKCDDTSGLYPTGTWLNPFCNDSAATVSNYFGPRFIFGGYSFHSGMDMWVAGQPNAPLCATAAGTVSKISSTGGCGNSIIVMTDDKLSYVYCHMKSAPLVNEGDHVEAGDPIGFMGTTGNSTGEHLHWEISTLGGQGVNAANPMCLIKTKPDILAKLNFNSVTKASPTFDYRCERRSDLNAWAKTG